MKKLLYILLIFTCFAALSASDYVTIKLNPQSKVSGAKVQLQEIASLSGRDKDLIKKLSRINIAQTAIPGQTRFLSKNKILLSPDAIDSICSKLNAARENSGLLSSWQHSSEIKNRYQSNTKCPKCGGNLVKSVSNRGQRKGIPFLSCSNYPRCKYSKDL